MMFLRVASPSLRCCELLGLSKESSGVFHFCGRLMEKKEKKGCSPISSFYAPRKKGKNYAIIGVRLKRKQKEKKKLRR